MDPTKRFSNRVEHYAKYRPDYPVQVLAFLKNDLQLKNSDVVADIGSGTGIFTRLLLSNGNKVFAVEPNHEMRHVAENDLRNFSNFINIEGTAEATALESSSIDFITAAQAFHWFHPDKAKQEFKRILQMNGWVLFIWNDPKEDDNQFASGYKTLKTKYGIDFQQVKYQRITADRILNEFFSPYACEVISFQNYQDLNLTGLQGRLLSSSYISTPDHYNYITMIAELRGLFERHQKDGLVRIDYDCKVYFGQL